MMYLGIIQASANASKVRKRARDACDKAIDMLGKHGYVVSKVSADASTGDVRAPVVEMGSQASHFTVCTNGQACATMSMLFT